jgi:hypothetical protein
LESIVMQSWLRASALAAAVLGANVFAVGSASAADLYNTYPSPRAGSAYDDPRYADLYGTPPPPPRYDAPYKPHYEYRPEPRYGHPVPSEPIYRDRYPRQYSEAPLHAPRAYSAGPVCLAKDEISFNLERDGWRDRCSGDIIAARPIDNRGPYADYERPYRTY